MSKLEKIFSSETEKRLVNLENTLEEFMENINEENLKLQIPNVKDISKAGLELEISDNALKVYQKGQLAGSITLE